MNAPKNLIVQKFGGTSVADIERITNVAKIIKEEVEKGNQVVVIVSAMAGVTNQLLELGNNFSIPNLNDYNREMDAIVATGEMVSASLVSLALQNLGLKARSLNGWQVKIKTDNKFGNARIKNIETQKIKNLIARGYIPVVTGFQGINGDNLTTLGRGGSDISAVAIAAALKAERCDIYTDVEGIYSADPNIVKDAIKIDHITYEEIIDMAHNGAKVLHPLAAEIGAANNLKLRVLSTFSENTGTLILNGKAVKNRFKGVSVKKSQCVINLKKNLCRDTLSKKLYGVNANFERQENLISCDITDLQNILKNISNSNIVSIYKPLNKVSVTAINIRNNKKIIEKAFVILQDKAVNIIASTINDNSIAFFIEDDPHMVANDLHYGLK